MGYMQGRSKSFMHIAADYGPVLGLIFCVAFFAAIYALRYPAMSLVALVAAMAVPVATWIMMRRTWIKSLCTMPFATLWTQGIMAFACGGMILALATYVYFKWVEPDLLINVLENQVERWKVLATEESLANARALTMMIEGGAVPHPSEISIQLVCLAVFTGSMLSMLVAFVVRLGRNKKK